MVERDLPELKLIHECFLFRLWVERRDFASSEEWEHTLKCWSISINEYSVIMLLQLMLSWEHPTDSGGREFRQSRSSSCYEFRSTYIELYNVLLTFRLLTSLSNDQIRLYLVQVFFSFTDFLFFQTLFKFPIFFQLLQVQVLVHKFLSKQWF
jgi:hypothetical protein